MWFIYCVWSYVIYLLCLELCDVIHCDSQIYQAINSLSYRQKIANKTINTQIMQISQF